MLNSCVRFLWVDLQLPRLKRCISGDDVVDTLQKLPSGIHATYQRILENIDSSDVSIDRARHVFECVASAKTPLTPAQITEIFFIDLDNPVKTSIDTDTMNNITDPEAFILEKCPGFLNITDTPVHSWEAEPTHRTVQFIHFSAQECLMSAELKKATTFAQRYSFDALSADITIAKICLSALNKDGLVATFQAYTDNYWEEHVSARNEDVLSELLDLFLRMNSPAFVRWVVARFKQGPDFDTVFHCAARLGLYHHLERMLGRSRHDPSIPANGLIKTRDSSGRTALHDAASNGRADCCRFLLEHGALVDDVDNGGNTPLHKAAVSGNLETVRLLLQQPAADGSNAAGLRCRTRNMEGQTPLHEAAYLGDAEVCRLLLEHGALVNEKDNDGKTPLRVAKEYSFGEAAIPILLEYGAKDVPNRRVRVRARVRNEL